MDEYNCMLSMKRQDRIGQPTHPRLRCIESSFIIYKIAQTISISQPTLILNILIHLHLKSDGWILCHSLSIYSLAQSDK